jgi:hypothetical protein
MKGLEREADKHTKTNLKDEDGQGVERYKLKHPRREYAEFGGSAASAHTWDGTGGYDRCHPLCE